MEISLSWNSYKQFFAHFSCRFLNLKYFFQSEFELFSCNRAKKTFRNKLKKRYKKFSITKTLCSFIFSGNFFGLFFSVNYSLFALILLLTKRYFREVAWSQCGHFNARALWLVSCWISNLLLETPRPQYRQVNWKKCNYWRLSGIWKWIYSKLKLTFSPQLSLWYLSMYVFGNFSEQVSHGKI